MPYITLQARRQKLISKLRNIAASRGVSVVDSGNGSYELKGPRLTVDYRPFASPREARLRGSTYSRSPCDAHAAVSMARETPPMSMEKEKRSGRARSIRQSILGERSEIRCHWCPTMIDIDSSTLEHIIPLARGGVNAPNNRTLSCRPCNQSRGCSMRELHQWPAPAVAT